MRRRRIANGCGTSANLPALLGITKSTQTIQNQRNPGEISLG